MVTKIIIKMAKLGLEGKSISDLTADLKMPKEAEELRFNITAEDFRSYGEKVIADLENWCKKKSGYTIADDNREGLRVSIGDSWFLLRLSVHDPVMPMNIESDSVGGVRAVLSEISEFFYAQSQLDTSALKKFLK